MARILTSLLALLGVSGCQKAMPEDPRTIKELIEACKDVPLGKSIDAVSLKLARCEILMPTQEVHQKGKPLLLAVASDKQGHEWVYAYSDEPELLAAFPNGSPFVRMQFRDAFGIVERDARFRGIFINHTDKYQYLIPREVFERVRAALDATAGAKPTKK